MAQTVPVLKALAQAVRPCSVINQALNRDPSAAASPLTQILVKKRDRLLRHAVQEHSAVKALRVAGHAAVR